VILREKVDWKYETLTELLLPDEISKISEVQQLVTLCTALTEMKKFIVRKDFEKFAM
jgi:hypothetical protein